MKILHVLNTGSYSGAENVAITIINKMKADNEIIYVSLDGQIRKYLEDNEIKFEPIKKMTIKEIKRVLKKYNPDIIHAHDFTASVICALACRKEKIISHIHNNSKWIKKLNIKSILYLLAAIKFDKILLVSDSIIKEYFFRKLIQKKVCVIGNPIETQQIIKKASENTKSEYSDIIFLGRFSEAKNPKKFIEIIREISNILDSVKAIMVGNGPLKKECERLIKEYKIEDRIIIKDFMENPFPLLKNSKILCMTSKWEGFGLVAVEALTLGKPVVATCTGGIPDIVDESCGITTNDMNDFKNEIIKLLIEKEYYENKSKNALSRVSKFNNINSYIKKLFEIYNE